MLQRGNGIHAIGHVTALGDIRPGIKMEYNEEEKKENSDDTTFVFQFLLITCRVICLEEKCGTCAIPEASFLARNSLHSRAYCDLTRVFSINVMAT